MATIDELIKNTIDLRTNPAGVKRVIYDAMEAMLGGEYNVPNPSNPFSFCLEAACFTATAGMMRNEVASRHMYRSLSQTYSDLYRHMSDADYLNRFSSPGRMPFTITLDADEVRERAIQDGPVKRMTIPRESNIIVDGIAFTMQYPIDIRVMAHGGFQVMYDTSLPSPIQTLETNVVDHRTYKADISTGALAGRTLLTLYFDVLQVRLDTYTEQLNRSTGFLKTYGLTDKFHYCRVYVSSASGEWSEIRTTHSEQVFDEDKPTAVLRVIEDAVEVNIPQIYFTKEVIGKNIRVDVFTTQGDLFLNLQRFTTMDYSIRWDDLNRFESEFAPAFRALATKIYMTEGPLSGGTNGLTFEQMKERVIYGSLGGTVRKTQKQLFLDMQDKGYNLISEIDHITNRQYLAVRGIQPPTNRFIASQLGCTVKPLQATFNEITSVSSVFDNGLRATIDSGTLFKITDGILGLVSNTELTHLSGLNKDMLANAYQQNNYLYNPYHVVLDITNNQFDTRVYYLDKPVINRREFIDDNDTTLLQVGGGDVLIERVMGGYRVLLLTKSSEEYKELPDTDVHVQLVFTPSGSVMPVGINGSLIGKRPNGERLFEFIIESRFDVTSDNELMLTNFKKDDMSQITVGIPLAHHMDIVYAVSNYNADGMVISDIDKVKRGFMLPPDAIGVMQERVKVTFGQSLSRLWRKARVVVDSLGVRRYEEDVPMVYDNNVYETDPLTGYFKYNIVDGKAVRTLLHARGDVVLQDGDVVYAHRKGDVKIENGESVFIGGRQKLLQFDTLLFEALFLVAETSLVTNYRRQVTEQVATWITRDIDMFSSELLENTSLWFHPISTVGDVSVIVKDGLESVLPAAQSFNVTYYLDRRNHGNLSLRSNLNQVAVNAVASVIGENTIRRNDIVKNIKALTGDEVIDVSVSGLGGLADLELVTLNDPASKLSVAKKLVVLADGTINLINDVNVTFEVHRE